MSDRSEIVAAGVPIGDAKAVIVLLHGRGATAEDILGLSTALDPTGGLEIAWFAPQAAGNSWYPERFLEDIQVNEPQRTAALDVIDTLVGDAVRAGVPEDRIGIIGFSQGACLALEYAAFGSARAGYIGALSGGVMGPLEDARSIEGGRSELRVFIGCGDQDGHIPLAHAERSARLLETAGATVDYREYPGVGHIINDDEVGALREPLTKMATTPTT
jgi:predicted esterase